MDYGLYRLRRQRKRDNCHLGANSGNQGIKVYADCDVKSSSTSITYIHVQIMAISTLWFRQIVVSNKAKIPLVHNVNVNDECECNKKLKT